MADSRRILHLLAPAETGGLERVVAELSAGLRRKGDEVLVGIVLDEPGVHHPFVEQLREWNVPHSELQVGSRRYLRERKLVGELCDTFDPDVVHTHGYRCDVLDAGVARDRGIATVSTAHGFTGGSPKNRLLQWIQRRSYSSFDVVVAVSAPLRHRLSASGVPDDQIAVIRNAWRPRTEQLSRSESRRRLELPSEAFVAGWVGRFSREKAPDLFVEALERLETESAIGCMIGDGALRGEIAERARASALRGRLHLPGSIPKAERFYRAFDVFVLSSRTEGTPMVLFEAMNACVPIVATKAGGVPDVVSRSEARLVEPEDVEGLADAIADVRRDSTDREGRTRRAKERLEREFSVGRWLDRYRTLYRKIS